MRTRQALLASPDCCIGPGLLELLELGTGGSPLELLELEVLGRGSLPNEDDDDEDEDEDEDDAGGG